MASYQIDENKNLVEPSGITILKKTFSLTPVPDTFSEGFDLSCDNSEELINTLIYKDVIVAYNVYINRNVIINSNNYESNGSLHINEVDRIVTLYNKTDTGVLRYRINNWSSLSEGDRKNYESLYSLAIFTKSSYTFEVYYIE